jgi:hypothetical protein
VIAMTTRAARTSLFAAIALVAASAAVAPRPAPAAICAIDPVPAATLLYPFFEVDLDDRQARNTVLTVENASEAPIVAHVTLWSDWAIPVLNFDVYLAGLDVQTIDLAAAMLDGVLPSTGSAVSPHGPLSAPPVAFPACNNGTTPGSGPLYGNPALAAPLRTHLQNALTGRMSSLTAKCHGANHGDNVARGYVTIDANDQCSLLFPSSAGYFNEPGPSSRRNVLAGDFALRRDDGTPTARAFAFRAVAVEAMPQGEPVPGGRTFYGRYVNGNGTDGREPLPTIFEPRFANGGAFSGGTSYFIWRETAPGTPAEVNCGSAPSWSPLSTEVVPYFNEQEDRADVSQSFPIAVNFASASVSPHAFGRTHLDLQHGAVTPIYGGPKAQAWVASVAIGTISGMGFAHAVPAAHHPVSCTP